MTKLFLSFYLLLCCLVLSAQSPCPPGTGKITNLGKIRICKGDSVRVCGAYFKNQGTYTSVCQSWKGCDSTIYFSIEHPVAEILGGGSLNCFNGAVVLQAGAGLGPVVWKNAAGQTVGTDNAYTATTAGKYTLASTVTLNGKLCAVAKDTTVQAVGTLKLAVQQHVVLNCWQPTAVINAMPNMPATFSWKGPSGFTSVQASPYISRPGNYTVVASTTGGCTASAVFFVMQDFSGPNVVAGGGVLSCATPSVSLNVTTSPNNSSILSYKWSGQNGFSSTIKSPSVSMTGTYTVTVTNMLNGCTNTSSAQVTSDGSLPNITTTGGALTCANTSVELKVNTGNVPNATVLWTGPNGFVSNLLSPVVSTPGVYTVVVTNPANACSSSALAQVLQNNQAALVSAFGGNLSCLATSVMLQAVTASIGTTYAWSGPNNFSSTLRNPVVTQPGAYTVTVTNAGSCTGTATVIVGTNSAPVPVAITGGNLTCSQTSVLLKATSTLPLTAYNWTGPNGYTSTQTQATATLAGVYTVTVTSGTNGCTGTASFTVSGDATQPTAQATGGVLGCSPPTRQLNCTTNLSTATFAWSGPDGFGSSVRNPMVNQPGTYRVTVTNPSNGCNRSAATVVFENGDAPQVFLYVESVGGNRRQLNCFTTAITPEFTWTGPNGFNATVQNPVVTIPGLYAVLVTDGISACQSYRTILVPAANISPGTTVQSRLAAASWQAFPNPATTTVQLRHAGKGLVESTQVLLVDATGRLILEQTISGASNLELDLGSVPTGLYRLILRSDKNLEIKALSVQR